MSTNEPPTAAGPRTPPRSLAASYIRAADRLYVLFAACMVLAWLTAVARTGEGWSYVARNVGVLLLFAGLWPIRLTNAAALRAGGLLRIGIACVVLPINYLQTGPLLTALAPHAPAQVEAFLQRGDHALMGADYHTWLLSLRHPVATEILQLCYGSFFLLPMILVLVLVLRDKRAHVFVLLFAVPATFLTSYAVYLLLPARSPGFLHEHLAGGDGIWLASYLWEQIREAAAGVYDAFPSGHTAVTLVVLWYAWRLDRLAFAILFPIGAGLILSTVYLQYHYLLDLPAGALLAAIVVFWDRSIRRRHAARVASAG